MSKVPMTVSYEDDGVTVAFCLTKEQMRRLGWQPMDHLTPVITKEGALHIRNDHQQIRQDSEQLRQRMRDQGLLS